ncbi:SH3 domain-containing protein [Caldilinea sp.]|uniref:SH3 domain-containing protein n=1 Tax=Caldilinea sp. TaxID=2293560 RepID=UPI002BE2CD0B|nr:SH3 domain-containing protein [Caldilinea sp.]HRA66938.1 SH3 domain-containing protein [Caldilinea sp.]
MKEFSYLHDTRQRFVGQLRCALVASLLLIFLFVTGASAQSGNVQSGSATPSTGQVSVVRLNLRVSPSISSPVVTRLTQGDTVKILAASDDGRWYKVATADGRTGWLYTIYITAEEKTSAKAGDTDETPSTADAPSDVTIPVEPTTAPIVTEEFVSPTAFDDGAVVATTTPARMNVRGGPGTQYPVVASAAAGARYEIIGLNPARDWYQVRVPNQAEPTWIFANLATFSGDLESVPQVAEADLPAAPEPATVVTTASAPAVSVAPVAAPAAAPNTSTGFGYGITTNMWQGDKQGVATLVKQLGFGWVKQQVRWEYAEPQPGAIQWQEMDSIVDGMNGNGINMMFSVVTSPPWSRPTLGGTGGPPEDFQLFANFLGGIAGRYCGRLQAIEVWNEQNLRREWEGFPLEPASYMDLLKRSYNAIKGACPAMLVISGATTPAGYSDVAFDDVDYLRGMYQNGLKQYSDGIGIHPSGFANPPSVLFQDWEVGNYSALSHVNHRSFYFLSTLRESRRVMEEFGDINKRLWPTEFGWGSTPSPFPGYEYEARIDEATQARWSVEAYNIMAGSGYVAVPMLWNLNYPRDTEMGAFAVAGRPAFDALRAMMGR